MPPFATLHTTTTILHARATKILAAANINDLELYIPPNFIYGQTNKTPEYLSKFPHGKLPALETPDGFYLGESSAIAFFVAESGPKKDQLLGRSVQERALVHMWASLADTDLSPNADAVLTPIFGVGPYIPEVVEDKEARFIRALGRLEHHLAQEGKVWLVRDDELSLADLIVAASLWWPLKIFMDKEYRRAYPGIVEWWGRLMGVEEVSRAFGGQVVLCETRPGNDGSFGERARKAAAEAAGKE